MWPFYKFWGYTVPTLSEKDKRGQTFDNSETYVSSETREVTDTIADTWRPSRVAEKDSVFQTIAEALPVTEMP